MHSRALESSQYSAIDRDVTVAPDSRIFTATPGHCQAHNFFSSQIKFWSDLKPNLGQSTGFSLNLKVENWSKIEVNHARIIFYWYYDDSDAGQCACTNIYMCMNDSTNRCVVVSNKFLACIYVQLRASRDEKVF